MELWTTFVFGDVKNRIIRFERWTTIIFDAQILRRYIFSEAGPCHFSSFSLSPPLWHQQYHFRYFPSALLKCFLILLFFFFPPLLSNTILRLEDEETGEKMLSTRFFRTAKKVGAMSPPLNDTFALQLVRETSTHIWYRTPWQESNTCTGYTVQGVFFRAQLLWYAFTLRKEQNSIKNEIA